MKQIDMSPSAVRRRTALEREAQERRNLLVGCGFLLVLLAIPAVPILWGLSWLIANWPS